MISRKATRRIKLGKAEVGGGAPVSVQTMTKTDTHDVEATVGQIRKVRLSGCDIVRVAVADMDAVKALEKICARVDIPVIADIHFDHRLALGAIGAGVDGLRINPGNIGDADAVREIVRAARDRMAPIRVGVNGGSLEKDIAAKHGGPVPGALVESALRHVRILEELDYREIKISVKASSVLATVAAYRSLSSATDYPLHLGVTEAGTFLAGTVRSSAAIGTLLMEGIGDTIRVSLTDTPEREVKVGLELLRSLGLREPGPSVISCPTCGRTVVDVAGTAMALEEELETYYKAVPEAVKPVVAVMGCMVNGPGEAGEADIALAGGKGKFALYVGGEYSLTVSETDAVAAVMEEVKRFAGRKNG